MITLPGRDPRMIANNLEPFYNVHPGACVMDELEYLNISAEEAAKAMGIDVKTVQDILDEKAPVTSEFALMLEAYIGYPADTLTKIQQEYDMLAAKRNKTFMKKLENIRRIAAVF